QSTLSSAGFAPSTTLATTDFAQYVALMANPKEVLDRLGIADLRQSDLLALRVERKVLQELLLFHLTLDAAVGPSFAARPGGAAGQGWRVVRSGRRSCPDLLGGAGIVSMAASTPHHRTQDGDRIWWELRSLAPPRVRRCRTDCRSPLSFRR